MNKLWLRRSVCLFLTVLLVFTSCDSSGGRDNDDGSDEENTVVVCLGDSLTAGMSATTLGQDDSGHAYPAYLEEHLNATGDGTFDVINAGVSGDTSAEGSARVNGDVLAEDPDIVIVCLGANDFLGATSFDLDGILGEMRSNLEDIISAVDDGSREIFIAKFYNPDVARALLEYKGITGAATQNMVVSACDAMFEDLVPASSTNLHLINDIWAGVWGVNMSADGIHPTAAGYETMAETILEALSVLQ